jgi:ABC-type phosphate/phosphonate transport system substrate-binding protein
VATPIYSVEGCEGPRYSSAIVVNRDSDITISSLKGRRFAYNSDSSLSGYRSMRAIHGELDGFFGEIIKSGGHRDSARMVANKTAEVAAIDAVCWHMLQRFEVETASGLQVIGWTEKRPALPLITSLETSTEKVSILRQTLENISCTAQANAIFVTGFEDVPISEYSSLSSL